MSYKTKIQEYKDTIDTLEMMDSIEVYTFLMKKGQDLEKDYLSESRRLPTNQVTQCQYALYVDREDGRFKAYSDAMIAAGYAYVLVDVFNSMTEDEKKTVTVADFEAMELDKKLTMNRQTGYYQMIEIMLGKIQ